MKFDYKFIALFTCLGLFVLACVFYIERTAFTDSALILTEIMRNKYGFAIQVDRYGSFITQLFPIIAFRLGLPVAVVLWCYSISFIVFYSAVIGVLVWRKKEVLVLVYILYLTLMVSDCFYWVSNEYYQGIGWLFLALGILLNSKNKLVAINSVQGLVGAVFLFLAIFTHPLVMFTVVFIGLFYCVYNYGLVFYKHKYILLWATVVLCIIALKYYASTLNWYDSDKVKPNNIIAHIPKFFSLHSTKQFAAQLITHYWLYVLLFLCTCAMLVYNKKWLLFLLVFIYSFGYLVLVNATFYQGGMVYYMQSEWLVLSIFIALPFVIYLPQFMPKSKFYVLVISVVMMRLFSIWAGHSYFTKHAQWVSAQVILQQRNNTPKLVLPEAMCPPQFKVNNWGMAYESLWLSAVINPQKICTFFYTPNTENTEYYAEPNLFISAFKTDKDTFLDNRFLPLKKCLYTKKWIF